MRRPAAPGRGPCPNRSQPPGRAKLRTGGPTERRDGRDREHPRPRQLPHAGSAPPRSGGHGARQAARAGRPGRRRRRVLVGTVRGRVLGRHRRHVFPSEQHQTERRGRVTRADHRHAAVQRPGPDFQHQPGGQPRFRPRQSGRAEGAGGPAAGGREPQTDDTVQYQRGVRQQNGQSEQGRRPVVVDLAGHVARPTERRAQVRGQDEAAVRVLRRLVPDRARLAAAVLRVFQRRADQRELLPDRGGRVRVRRLPRRHVPPGEQADRHQKSRRNPGRRSAQVLQPAVAQLRSRLRRRRHQETGTVHVLQILHRLLGHQPAARQAGELFEKSFLRAAGGVHETAVPERLETSGRGEHRVLDDTREASDISFDLRTFVATDGRTRNVLLLPSAAAVDHVHWSS